MKPFGQPVTEIFDFEEGSRFVALTVATHNSRLMFYYKSMPFLNLNTMKEAY